MTIERPPNALEKAVLMNLDILKKEKQSEINITSLIKKWGVTQEQAERLMKLWIMNTGRKSYDIILSRTS